MIAYTRNNCVIVSQTRFATPHLQVGHQRTIYNQTCQSMHKAQARYLQNKTEFRKIYITNDHPSRNMRNKCVIGFMDKAIRRSLRRHFMVPTTCIQLIIHKFINLPQYSHQIIIMQSYSILQSIINTSQRLRNYQGRSRSDLCLKRILVFCKETHKS